MPADENFEFVKYLKKLIALKKDRQYLIKAIAEMCERAYRRGTHQALDLERNHTENMKDKFKNDKKLSEWRYNDISRSEGLDGEKISTKDRFYINNHVWNYFND